MEAHVTEEELRRFAAGALPADDVLRIARHLAGCAACAARAEGSASHGERAAEGWQATFDAPDHPDFETLAAHVDGTSDVSAHLEECATCREDVADLQRERARLHRPRRLPYYAAAAAAAAVLAFLALRPEPVFPPMPPVARGIHVPTRDYGRPDWNEAVHHAIATGTIEVLPAVHAFPPDVLRGASPQNAVTLHPTATYVESQTPAFTWSGLDVPVVVAVYDGDTPVARSPHVRNTWTPTQPLARGKTYGWQLEIGERVYPAPPASPAMFRIIDATTAQDLAEARQRFPNDPVLLGVLYARAGLRDRALEELRKAQDDTAARKLLAAVEVSGQGLE